MLFPTESTSSASAARCATDAVLRGRLVLTGEKAVAVTATRAAQDDARDTENKQAYVRHEKWTMLCSQNESDNNNSSIGTHKMHAEN
jgi:hypothetical protein